MRDNKNSKDDKSPQSKDEADRLAELMGLMSQEGVSDNKLRKILAFVERVLSEPEND